MITKIPTQLVLIKKYTDPQARNVRQVYSEKSYILYVFIIYIPMRNKKCCLNSM